LVTIHAYTGYFSEEAMLVVNDGFMGLTPDKKTCGRMVPELSFNPGVVRAVQGGHGD